MQLIHAETNEVPVSRAAAECFMSPPTFRKYWARDGKPTRKLGPRKELVNIDEVRRWWIEKLKVRS